MKTIFFTTVSIKKREHRKKNEGYKKYLDLFLEKIMSIFLMIKIFQKTSIMFKINKSGDVIEAKARGPHLSLEEEAIRVINLLPRFISGKLTGKAAIIPFSILIYFSSN